MSVFMIHACPQRMWYVNGYLIPSLIKQGIDEDDIVIWCDENDEGNLTTYMKSFKKCGEREGGTWHLQDDILIAPYFVGMVRGYDENKVVCGFGGKAKGFPHLPGGPPGVVKPKEMWYSFPCIHIPNKLAGECARWFFTDARYRTKFSAWVAAKKYDDSFFREFMIEKHGDMGVINANPNLVEHVDWLIGGSILNSNRGRMRSGFWYNEELVEYLKKQLNSR